MKIIKSFGNLIFMLLLLISGSALMGQVNAQTPLPYISQPDQCVKDGRSISTTDPFEQSLKCPATIADLQSLVLRVFGIINIVIGITMLFGIIRAGFLYVTSAGVPEKVVAASKSLRFAILGFLGVGFAYVALVTIGTIIIGTDGNRPNFIESNRIVFNFLQFQQ